MPASRQAAYQAARKARGLCITCGQGDERTAAGKCYCAACTALRLAAQQRARGTLAPGRRGLKKGAAYRGKKAAAKG